MKIGSERVSAQQLRMLEQARRGPTQMVEEFLYNITHDSDIRDESEELHPDWVIKSRDNFSTRPSVRQEGNRCVLCGSSSLRI